MSFTKSSLYWLAISLTLLNTFVSYQAHKTFTTEPKYNHVLVVDKRGGGESGAKSSVKFGTYVLLKHTATNEQETLFIENPFIADTYVVGNVYRYPDNPINIWEVSDLILFSMFCSFVIGLVFLILNTEKLAYFEL